MMHFNLLIKHSIRVSRNLIHLMGLVDFFSSTTFDNSQLVLRQSAFCYFGDINIAAFNIVSEHIMINSAVLVKSMKTRTSQKYQWELPAEVLFIFCLKYVVSTQMFDITFKYRDWRERETLFIGSAILTDGNDCLKRNRVKI